MIARMLGVVTAGSLALAAPMSMPVSAQGLSGLLGGGLPGIGSAGVGNVAGLLGYCMKNKLTGGTAARSVLGRLTGQPEVTSSPGFAQGQLGQVLGGNSAGGGQPFSLGTLKGQMKTRACDLVLKRAGSFL